MRYSARTVITASLAGMVSGGATAVLLALANRALHHPRSWTEPRLVIPFVMICLLLPVLRAGSTWLLTRLGMQMALDLRLELGRRIVAAPLRRSEEVGIAGLFVALTDDVGAIAGALRSLPVLFVQSAVLTGCLLYLGWLSPQALLGVVVLLAVGVATYRVPIRMGVRYQRKQRELSDVLWADLQALTTGLKELKLHASRRDALIRQMGDTGGALRDAGVRSGTLFSAAAGWGQMVVFGMVGAIAFLLPMMGPVRVETLTGYALVLLYLMTPLEVLMDTLPALTRARLGFQKVERLGVVLDDATTPQLAPPAKDPAAWERVELVDVSHIYHREDEGEFTLGPISFALQRGEIVFLVGGNGSGKTTLAKILTGLYAPAAGEVRLDGEAVTEATRDAYMQRFSVVFSDFYLFDRLLGLEGPDLDARATHYLEKLQLAHKLSVRDGRLSTRELSQGQRKRLALLTAYLEDRPIYLFDEWAADQDPVFKKLFYLELRPELRERGKTVIVISHDDHYYGVADRILKLDYGQLEYDGSPDRLQYRIGAVPALPAHHAPLV
jgi:putative ATP-binding cassette transporter